MTFTAEGVLKEVKATTLKAISGNNTESEFIGVDSEVSYVRAFLWDETMIPLCNDENLTLNFEA